MFLYFVIYFFKTDSKFKLNFEIKNKNLFLFSKFAQEFKCIYKKVKNIPKKLGRNNRKLKLELLSDGV